MNRGKKAAYNSLSSMLSQTVELVCGFVMPRLILSEFGSAHNGLLQSVSQFLSVVILLRAGIGGATRASLYKSLAHNDEKQISATIKATEIFMRKVALIFAGFVCAFSCVYPLLVQNEFDWFFSATLVLIVSVSTFVQYYFGITYQVLLQADQKQYISTLLNAGTAILNTVLSVILINIGASIHVVKAGSAFAFCLSPIIINIYARRHYNIDKTVDADFSSIKQRWDALFHQVAGFIYSNTDIVLLTIFTNLKEVSVYTTYCLVSVGLDKVMSTVITGVESAFGDMMVRDDKAVLIRNVRIYETLLHGVISVLFGVALVLITPFIQIYTKGVTDNNYFRPDFGYLLIISVVVHLIRQPYHSLIEVAGHFKQTKKIAIIQATINLLLSLGLIKPYGIIGVMIGTLVSDIYCGIAYRVYVKKYLITEIKYNEYIKRLTLTILVIVLVYLYSLVYSPTGLDTYMKWILYAIPITLFATIISVGVEVLFYKKESIELAKKMRGIINNLWRR